MDYLRVNPLENLEEQSVQVDNSVSAACLRVHFHLVIAIGRISRYEVLLRRSSFIRVTTCGWLLAPCSSLIRGRESERKIGRDD